MTKTAQLYADKLITRFGMHNPEVIKYIERVDRPDVDDRDAYDIYLGAYDRAKELLND